MAYRCEICHKGKMIGRSHRHHKGVASARFTPRAQKTLKVFKPNLQKTRILIDGIMRRVKICTNCLKKIRQGPGPGQDQVLG